jgi:hypothetical protein
VVSQPKLERAGPGLEGLGDQAVADVELDLGDVAVVVSDVESRFTTEPGS